MREATKEVAQQSGGRTGVIIALPLLLVVGSACDKSEQLRSALEVDQAGWHGQVSALKTRASDLGQRFKALPPDPSGTSMAVIAKRRRVEAAVAGTQQSLIDLDRTIDEGVRDVQAAIERGDSEGQQELTAAVARIGGYVHQQEQQVAATETALFHVGEGK
jgi:hypothetical protein